MVPKTPKTMQRRICSSLTTELGGEEGREKKGEESVHGLETGRVEGMGGRKGKVEGGRGREGEEEGERKGKGEGEGEEENNLIVDQAMPSTDLFRDISRYRNIQTDLLLLLPVHHESLSPLSPLSPLSFSFFTCHAVIISMRSPRLFSLLSSSLSPEERSVAWQWYHDQATDGSGSSGVCEEENKERGERREKGEERERVVRGEKDIEVRKVLSLNEAIRSDEERSVDSSAEVFSLLLQFCYSNEFSASEIHEKYKRVEERREKRREERRQDKGEERGERRECPSSSSSAVYCETDLLLDLLTAVCFLNFGGKAAVDLILLIEKR